MNEIRLARYTVGIIAGIALLAGCSSRGTMPPAGAGSVTAADNKLFAMTNPRQQGIPVQHPLAHSWMRRPPKGVKGTIWTSDVESATVDVISYPSGTLIGQVAGFSTPSGLCSDKNGNVYVADFGDAKGYEIQAGTTNVIDSWSTGGYTIGCSVSSKGDLAFTNFSPGGVVVFPGGGQTGTTYPGPGYYWAAGYDKKGHLFVECDYGSPCSTAHLAELSGSTWKLLNFDTTITFPGAVQLMGASLGVSDQEPNGMYGGAIYNTQVNGDNAHDVRTVNYNGSSSCSYGYPSFGSSWGSVSKKPNGLQSVKGAIKYIASSNGCGIGIWNAKKGGAFLALLQPPDITPGASTFTK